MPSPYWLASEQQVRVAIVKLTAASGRVLRCLASYGAITETGTNSYGPATTSYTFAHKKHEAAMEVWYRTPRKVLDSLSLMIL